MATILRVFDQGRSQPWPLVRRTLRGQMSGTRGLRDTLEFYGRTCLVFPAAFSVSIV